jgi:hypothetical protein
MKATDVDHSGLLLRVANLERQTLFWKIALAMILLARFFFVRSKSQRRVMPVSGRTTRLWKRRSSC